MSLLHEIDALHYKKNSNSQYAQAYQLLDNLEINSKAYILDIGCGHGHIISDLSRKALDGKAIGIDPSHNMIELARKSFPKIQYKNLEFYQAKAEDMNFPNDYFDIIVCTNVFMWIRDPQHVLGLISRFLKPGGRLFLFTYSKNTPYVMLFERVIEQYFPEKKSQSAVRTMLSSKAHADILINNRMSLDLYKIENIIFKYANEKDFKDYVKGWLSCYAPLTAEQKIFFLKKLMIESQSYQNISSGEFAIPHQSLSIIATKQLIND